jgi:GH35 family endo-1,4-beta-xylanase
MQRLYRFFSPILLTLLFSVYVAAQDDATLFAETDARIEQHRKEDVRIKVLDHEGKPVSGAVVDVEQLSHEFLFGSTIFKWGSCRTEEDNKAYNDRYAAMLNYATLGYYWPSYEWERGKPRHDHAKRVTEWCKAYGISTKGHPLAWNHADANWFKDVDTDELFRLQLARIEDCSKTMTGLIDRWDVVNEAVDFDRPSQSELHTAMWRKVGKIEFTKKCFVEARKANPNATLLINDYSTGDEYVNLIEQLVDTDGKRLYDVIGIQSHMHRDVWSNYHIWDVCQRFTRFGVPLHFTELTILSGRSGWEDEMQGKEWQSTPEGEAKQKEDVVRVYTMLFSHPAVEAITWWDFSDQGAWQNAPAGFLRDDMTPKPAYDALHDLIKNRWMTKGQFKTDENGIAMVRAFRGNYRVRVGESTIRLTVSKGKNEFEMKQQVAPAAE